MCSGESMPPFLVHYKVNIHHPDRVGAAIARPTAQGFDFSDDNWRFCLLTPAGDECACEGDCDAGTAGGHSHGGGADEISGVLAGGIYRHVHGGVLVTTNKKNGRVTIFLQRNGAADDDWVGRWNLRAMYRMPLASPMIMFMSSLFEMLLPVGAPPTRGPVYARLLQPPARRVPSGCFRVRPSSLSRARRPGPAWSRRRAHARWPLISTRALHFGQRSLPPQRLLSPATTSMSSSRSLKSRGYGRPGNRRGTAGRTTLLAGKRVRRSRDHPR